MKRKFLSWSLSLLMAFICVAPIQLPVFADDYGIEIGDYVNLGLYRGEDILWRCVDIDENGPLMLSDKILCLKPFDTAGDENEGSHARGYNSGQYRKMWGSNYWGDSNIRCWLNSTADGDEISWSCGNEPNSDETMYGCNTYYEAGFLSAFTDDELALIKVASQKQVLDCYENSQTKDENSYVFNQLDYISNYDAATGAYFEDRIFLLDTRQYSSIKQNKDLKDYLVGYPTEAVVTTDINPNEDTVDDETNEGALMCDYPWDYWLRTPYSDNTSARMLYATKGAVEVSSVSAYDDSVGIRPAFYLSSISGIDVTGEGSKEKPFVLTKSPIEIGEYVKMGNYQGEDILWRCVDIDENGPLMLSDKILSIKAFDVAGSITANSSHSRGYKNNSAMNYYRQDYGSNYWGDSNIRCWLNSDDECYEISDRFYKYTSEGVEWTCHNLPNGNSKADSYSCENGFMTAFSRVEADLIKEVTQKQLLDEKEYSAIGVEYHAYDKDIDFALRNYNTAYCEETTDKVFLPDIKQIVNAYKNLGDYYLATPTKSCAESNSIEAESKYAYWLRSPHNNSKSVNVRCVAPNGDVSSDEANSTECGVRPAFYFNLESVAFEKCKSGDGSEANPFEFKPVDVPVEAISLPGSVIISYDSYSWPIEMEVTPFYTSNLDFEWTSADTSIATVDENGNVFNNEKGSTYITAKWKNDSTVSARTRVIVAGVELEEIYSSALTSKIESDAFYPGDTEKLHTRFSGKLYNNRVRWASSKPEVASVDSYGNVCAHKAGDATIYALAENNDEVSYDVKVSSEISLNATDIILDLNNNATYQLIPENSDGTYYWSSSNPDVATVDKNGKVTAVRRGVAYITVTNQDWKKGQCFVTVKENTSTKYSYSFSNSNSSFGYSNDYSVPLERYMQLGLTETEAKAFYDWMGVWGGNCFGMSSSSMLFEDGYLNTQDYDENVAYPIDFNQPDSSTDAGEIKLREMIELLQNSQLLFSYFHSINPDSMKEQLDNGNYICLLLQDAYSGHAVVLYDYGEIEGGYEFDIYDCSGFVSKLTFVKTGSGWGWYFDYLNYSYEWEPYRVVYLDNLEDICNKISVLNQGNAGDLLGTTEEMSRLEYVIRDSEDLKLSNSDGDEILIEESVMSSEVEAARMHLDDYSAQNPKYTILLPIDDYTISGKSEEQVGTVFANDDISVSYTGISSTPLSVSKDMLKLNAKTEDSEAYSIKYTTFNNIFETISISGKAKGELVVKVEDEKTDYVLTGIDLLNVEVSVSENLITKSLTDLSEYPEITVDCEKNKNGILTLKIYTSDGEILFDSDLPEKQAADAPVYDLQSGRYERAQYLSFTKAEDEVIYYTADGSTPSAENGIIYSSPVLVNCSMTIKAVNTRYGYEDSEVVTLEYSIPNADIATILRYIVDIQDLNDTQKQNLDFYSDENIDMLDALVVEN